MGKKNDLQDMQSNCVFFDTDKGCRVLKERVCSVKKCTFYMTRLKYEENMKTDFLLLSFQKGAISKKRYLELFDCYHAGKKKAVM